MTKAQTEWWESKLDEDVLGWLGNETQKGEEKRVAIILVPDYLDELPWDLRRVIITPPEGTLDPSCGVPLSQDITNGPGSYFYYREHIRDAINHNITQSFAAAGIQYNVYIKWVLFFPQKWEMFVTGQYIPLLAQQPSVERILMIHDRKFYID